MTNREFPTEEDFEIVGELSGELPTLEIEEATLTDWFDIFVKAFERSYDFEG